MIPSILYRIVTKTEFDIRQMHVSKDVLYKVYFQFSTLEYRKSTYIDCRMIPSILYRIVTKTEFDIR